MTIGSKNAGPKKKGGKRRLKHIKTLKRKNLHYNK